MNKKLRPYIPNTLTFLSMACGLSAILISSLGFIFQAGLLILVSFILDSLDGFSARQLKANTEIGLQLDSLADMISLGVAPLVLIFHHLISRGFAIGLIFPPLIVAAWTGAYRLARFNLMPPKTSGRQDSLGLPIPQAGITLSLAVLSDLSYVKYSIPAWVYIVLILILSYLMASKISFPSIFWFFPSRVRTVLIILIIVLIQLLMPPYTTLLILCLGGLAVSTIRALYFMINGNLSRP